MTEAEERKAVVDAAMGYVGTPYRHAGMVKGSGVDCATLLICAFRDSGIDVDRRISKYPAIAAAYMRNAKEGKPIPYYPAEWHLHRVSDKYLSILLHYCREVTVAEPADIVVWKFGNAFSHAAIVVEWPRVVHARLRCAVQLDDVDKAMWLSRVGEAGPGQNMPRPMKILSYWGR